MDADVVVVGGGVVGLWSALELAKQGVKTILFEQFPYPHTRGSSHGQSRIIRTAYCEEEYASMMPESYRKWRELEKCSGKQLLMNTGLIKVFDTTRSDHMIAFNQVLDKMEKYAARTEVIPGEELEKRFPGMRFSSKYNAIYDGGASILKADNCLRVLQEMFRKHGGQIKDGEVVLSINPINAQKVEVKTGKQIYHCKSVVVTCGSFTNKILSSVGLQLPLTVMKAVTFYWKDKSDLQKYSHFSRFPCTSLDKSFYSIPAHEYQGLMKLCHNAIIAVDPERRDALSEEKLDLQRKRMAEFKKEIRTYFPEIDADGPAVEETCIYTASPDYGFIIDYHPKYKNIIVGAGFSGHGFKTAPSVGHMLSNMAIGLLPPYSLEPFAIKRFHRQSRL